MEHVYLVFHERESADNGSDYKIIGIYSSRKEADAAVGRLRNSKGFRDCYSGFSVDKYELNKDHWLEGFTEARFSYE